MVRFTLFGIPVEIQPWFWLGAAFFGGLGGAGMTPDDLKSVLIFMFAAAVSVLVHEFGHALTGRRLGGGQANIVLNGFGGLAYSRGGRFTRWTEFWRVFMGPGAGFLLFGLIALILVIAFGARDAGLLIAQTLFKSDSPVSHETGRFFDDHLPLWWLITSFLKANFWWGIINLAPVLPLDGGRITEIFARPKTLVYQIAIVAGITIAIIGLMMNKRYMAVMFGYFAYQNYRSLQDFYGRR